MGRCYFLDTHVLFKYYSSQNINEKLESIIQNKKNQLVIDQTIELDFFDILLKWYRNPCRNRDEKATDIVVKNKDRYFSDRNKLFYVVQVSNKVYGRARKLILSLADTNNIRVLDTLILANFIELINSNQLLSETHLLTARTSLARVMNQLKLNVEFI